MRFQKKGARRVPTEVAVAQSVNLSLDHESNGGSMQILATVRSDSDTFNIGHNSRAKPPASSYGGETARRHFVGFLM